MSDKPQQEMKTIRVTGDNREKARDVYEDYRDETDLEVSLVQGTAIPWFTLTGPQQIINAIAKSIKNKPGITVDELPQQPNIPMRGKPMPARRMIPEVPATEMAASPA